jgi:hypothetical protein
VMWHIDSGGVVQEIKARPTSLGVALSPDGGELAAAAGTQLSIYTVQDSK